MPDNAPLSADSAWLHQLVSEMIAHVAEHLNPLLPENKALVATGDQIILTSTATGYPKTVSSHSVRLPEHFDIGMIESVADWLLDDVQDLVITHLHEPWPLTADGRSTHAWATLDGQTIDFGFRVSGETENNISLPPFTIGPRPEKVLTAG
jgi:hypothetical protein